MRLQPAFQSSPFGRQQIAGQVTVEQEGVELGVVSHEVG
jgi:hypothetical protein